jgi:hypothetical protein
MRKDGQREMTKQIVASRNFANEDKNLRALYYDHVGYDAVWCGILFLKRYYPPIRTHDVTIKIRTINL